MTSISVNQIVNASIEDVWASWDDYANIAKFHSGLNASYLLDQSASTGMGAVRQCDLSDGKTFLKERVVAYQPQRSLVIDIYDTNVPIRNAQAEFSFEELGPNRVRVTMTMSFTPKMGVLGLALLPIMKRQFRKGLAELLKNNASYVEDSIRVRAVA